MSEKVGSAGDICRYLVDNVVCRYLLVVTVKSFAVDNDGILRHLLSSTFPVSGRRENLKTFADGRRRDFVVVGVSC